jgi:hypothetical protein
LNFTLSGKGTGSGEVTGTMAFDRKDYGVNGSIPFRQVGGPLRFEVDGDLDAVPDLNGKGADQNVTFHTLADDVAGVITI